MLGADGKAPERGAAGAFLTAGARRAGGNGGAEKCLPLVIAKGKFLVGDADADGRHWIDDLRFTNYEVRFFKFRSPRRRKRADYSFVLRNS